MIRACSCKPSLGRHIFMSSPLSACAQCVSCLCCMEPYANGPGPSSTGSSCSSDTRWEPLWHVWGTLLVSCNVCLDHIGKELLLHSSPASFTHGHACFLLPNQVDIMDKGTDCRDVLLGRGLRLKHGWVAVVNRGQADINKRVSMQDARKREEDFFRGSVSI